MIGDDHPSNLFVTSIRNNLFCLQVRLHPEGTPLDDLSYVGIPRFLEECSVFLLFLPYGGVSFLGDRSPKQDDTDVTSELAPTVGATTSYTCARGRQDHKT